MMSTDMELDMELRTNTVKAAMESWFEEAWAHAECGAYDTEPRAVFEGAVRRILAGKAVKCPQFTAGQWELFASSMDCTEATRALNAALYRVWEAICKSSPYDGVRAFVYRYGYSPWQ